VRSSPIGLAALVGCAAAPSSREGLLADCVHPRAFAYDADGDGHGDPRVQWTGCTPPPGYVFDITDCDDMSRQVAPGAEDICGDGIDQDCDGQDAVCQTSPDRWTGATADGVGWDLAVVGDANGDGVDDLVVSGPKAAGGVGRVYVLAGPLTSSTQAPSAAFEGDLGEQFGSALAALGDVNDDGVDDFAWGAPYDGLLGDGAGRVWIHHGPANGSYAGGMGSSLVAGDNGVWGVGIALSSGHDLTGDGEPDLVIGAPYGGHEDTYTGRAFVLPLPLPTDHVASVGLDGLEVLGEELAGNLGEAVAALPDLDGDGNADLAVAAPAEDGSAGRVYLFWGPLTGAVVATDADVQLGGPAAGHRFGSALAGGDLTGSGQAELVVGAPSFDGGGVWVLDGPTGQWVARLDPDGTSDGLGAAVEVGDADGVGPDDLLVGAVSAADGRGAAALWLGPVSGVRTVSDTTMSWTGDDPADGLGTSVAIHPDFTGDGEADVLIGIPGAHSGDGEVRVVTGPFGEVPSPAP